MSNRSCTVQFFKFFPRKGTAMAASGQLLRACYLAFNGVSGGEIAQQLQITESTLSRWRKTPIWEEFEKELIKKKKEILTEQLETDAAQHAAIG